MSKISVLQKFHFGNLPVKVLAPDIIHKFQNLYPGFFDEIKDEVKFSGMQSKIEYDDRRKPVSDLAMIDDTGKIRISEPYLAFLWCLCFAVLTLYREREKEMTNNVQADRAVKVFNYAVGLFTNCSEWDLDLPNPQEFDVQIDANIGETNGLLIYAACFVLCHEFSHQQLGHLTYIPTDKESIKEEFAADKSALEIFLKVVSQKGIPPEEINTLRLGAIIGIGSILFPDECWEGAPTHPNSEERFFRIVEKISEDDNDDLWQFGIFVLILWGVIQNKSFIDPTGLASAKANYRAFADNLKAQQQCI